MTHLDALLVICIIGLVAGGMIASLTLLRIVAHMKRLRKMLEDNHFE